MQTNTKRKWVTNKEPHLVGFFSGRLINLVPRAIFQIILKRHYWRTIASFTEDQLLDLKLGRFLVHRNDCVIDIGANIGVYTKFFSKWVGKYGRVYSIEPIPSTYEYLTNNINRLHLDNVYSFQCAISDTPRRLSLSIPINKFGLVNHYRAQVSKKPNSPDCETHFIEANTVDKLLVDSRRPVALIKIDTEGHELPCIIGATATITRWKPALLVEVSSNLTQKNSEGYLLSEHLKRFGYHIFRFDGFSLTQKHLGNIGENYFFLTPEHVIRLKKQGVYNPSDK